MARNAYRLTRVLGIVFLSLAAGMCGFASAQVPDLLNYQGRLTDPGGNPVTASVPMVFKLYTVASGGAAVYTETQTVSVTGGIFNVAIGTVTPLNLPFDVPYYLGVTVGADAEMAPRQAVLSSAYAQRADTANLLAPTATLPAVQITGTLATAQLGDGSVTKPKLSAAGGSAGQVLGTDGANLQWQSVGGAGTVTSVGTGAGLTGGPITAAGTINLAATQLLPTTACATNQIPKWSGSAWACQPDANSGGTVTSVTAGNGLTGGTITTSGTLAVDPTSSTLTGNFFKNGGNAFGGFATLGTSDNYGLDIYVNGSRVMGFYPAPNSPNMIGGSANNTVGVAYFGQTIGGGGAALNTCLDPTAGTATRNCANAASGPYTTVAGGLSNQANADYATTSGGYSNTANDTFATVAGGLGNTARLKATVSGGQQNAASGNFATVGGGLDNSAAAYSATVAGGFGNNAIGQYSTATGGYGNQATSDYAAIGGGYGNNATALYATVAGGFDNFASGQASFAAGSHAKTILDGAFVWADAHASDFNTSSPNEFAARATGGVRFVTNIDGAGNALRTVYINSNGEMTFGTTTRQMLKLWDDGNFSHYGIGVQNSATYFRTGDGANFAWFAGGSHSDTTFDPGVAPGSPALLMTLSPSNTASAPTGTARAQSFLSVSDRNAKADFAPVDAGAVLAHVVALPVTTWVYRTDPATPHIGPVAQDFHAAFRVGSDDRTINTTDEGGVALAAIQGLNAKLERQVAEKEEEIEELRRHVHELESMMDRIAAAGYLVDPVPHSKLASGTAR
jgi:trimeric autotransporter adhesin